MMENLLAQINRPSVVIQITTEVSYVGFFEVYLHIDVILIQLQHRYSVKIHTSELKLVQTDQARPSDRPSIVTRDNNLYK